MKLNNNTIKTFFQTTDPVLRKSIQDDLRTHSFENELDTITHSDLLLDDFRRLDKKYKRQFKSNANYKWYVASAFLITIIGSLFIYIYSNDSTTQQRKIRKVSVINSPNWDKSKTLQTKTSIKEQIFKTISDSKENKPALSSNTIANPNKPETELTSFSNFSFENKADYSFQLNPLQTKVISQIPTIKRLGSRAREVILYDFVLLDYREYRKKSNSNSNLTVQTYGTPANQKTKMEDIENEFKIDEVSYFQFLSETMYDFKTENFSKALQNFNLILETYSDDANALFYGALCEIKLKKYNDAIQKLTNVCTNKFLNFDEEAQWNLLKCYIETDQLDKAKILQQEIINGNGFYSKNARDLKF